MSDPINPNYKPGVGRLVTDRFDFQKHVEGQTLRHTAPSIDLFPTVVVNGNDTTTVQDAIYQLSVALNPPVIQDATTFQKGIIQLTGDISGAATNVRVVALRGYPINTNIPVTNDVLTWNGTNWGPSPNLSPFTASGDLAGSNITQQVINLSGNGSIVNINVPVLRYASTITSPTIDQDDNFVGTAQNLSLTGQNVSFSTTGNGGSINLTGGHGGFGTSDLNGGVSLRLGSNTPANMVQALHLQQFPQVRRITALNANTANFATSMGTLTGDLVTFVGDAAQAPTNPPVGGTVLYSSAGKMHVRQTDNTDVIIGQDPNPAIWGSLVRGNLFTADGQVYSTRNVVTTAGTSQTDALGTYGGITFGSFPIPQYTTILVEVVMVGKKDGALDGMSVRMSGGYCRDSGSASKMATFLDGYLIGPPDGDGVPYIEHIKSTFLALAWTRPSMELVGNAIHVKTGASSGVENITWFTTAKFYIGPSYSNP